MKALKKTFQQKIKTYPKSAEKRTHTGKMLERYKATTNACKELGKTEDKAYGFGDNIETSPFNIPTGRSRLYEVLERTIEFKDLTSFKISSLSSQEATAQETQ